VTLCGRLGGDSSSTREASFEKEKEWSAEGTGRKAIEGDEFHDKNDLASFEREERLTPKRGIGEEKGVCAKER